MGCTDGQSELNLFSNFVVLSIREQGRSSPILRQTGYPAELDRGRKERHVVGKGLTGWREEWSFEVTSLGRPCGLNDQPTVVTFGRDSLNLLPTYGPYQLVVTLPKV